MAEQTKDDKVYDRWLAEKWYERNSGDKDFQATLRTGCQDLIGRRDSEARQAYVAWEEMLDIINRPPLDTLELPQGAGHVAVAAFLPQTQSAMG